MKTIFVNVQIELQVTEEQEAELLESVKDQLELLDTIISKAELASDPKIQIDSVDDSSIYEV